MEDGPTESVHETLRREKKQLVGEIKECYSIIRNNPDPALNTDNLDERVRCYAEALRQEITDINVPLQSKDTIIVDVKIKLRNCIKQIHELVAYRRGVIADCDTEILRCEKRIKYCKEALQRDSEKVQTEQTDVTPEQLQAAKEKFTLFKVELHKTIRSLFREDSDEMISLFADLCKARLDKNSDGFVDLSEENYKLSSTLRRMNIVTVNPYDNSKIRLTF